MLLAKCLVHIMTRFSCISQMACLYSAGQMEPANLMTSTVNLHCPLREYSNRDEHEKLLFLHEIILVRTLKNNHLVGTSFLLMKWLAERFSVQPIPGWEFPTSISAFKRRNQDGVSRRHFQQKSNVNSMTVKWNNFYRIRSFTLFCV